MINKIKTGRVKIEPSVFSEITPDKYKGLYIYINTGKKVIIICRCKTKDYLKNSVFYFGKNYSSR